MEPVGVLALQGAVSEHLDMLAKIGLAGKPVRSAEDFSHIAGLILPGGESTAISRLITRKGLAGPIRILAETKPVLGTCAGMILCAKKAHGSGGALPAGMRDGGIRDGGNENAESLEPLNLMDITVRRNGFGRQTDSFETGLDIAGIGRNVPGVFIRAPYIERMGENVTPLAEHGGKTVMARCGNITVAAFHPELAEDLRIFRHIFGNV